MTDSPLQLATLPLAAPLLVALVRTGIVLSISALVLSGFLRVFRVGSPKVRRVAYVAVLAQGWLFLPGPFAVPLPKYLEELASKASAGAVTQAASATAVDQHAENRIVTDPSIEELLSRTDELRPLQPRVDGASKKNGGASHDPSRRDSWYSNEWDSAMSAETECLWRDAANGAGRTTRSAVDKIVVATPPPRESQPITRRQVEEIDGPPSLEGVNGRVIVKRQSTGEPELSPAAPELRTLAPTPFPWPLLLVGVWAAGIVVLVGRAVWNYVRVVRRMPPPTEDDDVDPEWADEWDSLQRQAGIRRLVPLVIAEHAGPALFRLPGGYRLVVPESAWRTLERSQRLAILRHELAHIVRRDVWKSLAVRVLALPHWFNPLAWLVVRRFDECAEWACDEAARRAAPEDVPDYARALLQLVQRAEPVFFATRAAGSQGLSLRIRRLLLPAKEKGSAMKTAVLIVLALGFSLANLTRLQTRAENDAAAASPAPDGVATSSATTAVAGTPVAAPAASAAPPAVSPTAAPPAAAPAVVATPATAASAAIAGTPVAVPSATPAVDPTGGVPATAATLPPAGSESIARPVGSTPIARPVGSTPIARPAAQDPSAVPARASTRARTPKARPSAAIVLGADRSPFGLPAATPAPGGPPAGAPTAALDPTPSADPFAAAAASEHRLARVNLGYILKNMNEFRVRQERLEANDVTWKQLLASRRDEMVKTAKARIAAEKDPLIKDLLEKGIAQKGIEISKEVNPKLADAVKQIRNQMLAKIVAEIGAYAREHKLLVVRRADFSSQKEFLMDLNVGPAGTPTPGAGPDGVSIADGAGNALSAKRIDLYVNAQAPGDTWDQEVLYVAGGDNQHEVDISIAIVQRLNAGFEREPTEPVNNKTP